MLNRKKKSYFEQKRSVNCTHIAICDFILETKKRNFTKEHIVNQMKNFYGLDN